MKILVTAGPTREPIDPVRFITNRSTGKMGYAIAEEAERRGHDVLLISGPTAVPTPKVRMLQITTAADMLEAVTREIVWADALVMAAAVADFRPVQSSAEKIKKADGLASLQLEPTTDILSSIRAVKGRRIYVGFAAESRNIQQEAERKLISKGLDMVVANDITRDDAGFESETNAVILITSGRSPCELPLMSKTQVALHIVEWLEEAGKGRE